MSLYIRVFNSFWNHRKTARARSRLGDDAFWILPRLWSYAAESQPDGNFANYESSELAAILGCQKHADNLKTTLIDAGFMHSDGQLHDWQDHNGYHSTYAERAKKAAQKRWRGEEKTRNEMKGKETSIATSMLQACYKHATSIDTPQNIKESDVSEKAIATPWTVEQCIAAAAPIGMRREDIDAFWAHYAAVDFIDAAGRKITNLPAALAKWKARKPSHGKTMDAPRPAQQQTPREVHDREVQQLVDQLQRLDGSADYGRALSAARDKYERSVVDEALEIMKFRSTIGGKRNAS